MPDRENQHDILRGLVTVQRDIPRLTVREDELPQVGLARPTDER
jgi:hypothetical protein